MPELFPWELGYGVILYSLRCRRVLLVWHCSKITPAWEHSLLSFLMLILEGEVSRKVCPKGVAAEQSIGSEIATWV